MCRSNPFCCKLTLPEAFLSVSLADSILLFWLKTPCVHQRVRRAPCDLSHHLQHLYNVSVMVALVHVQGRWAKFLVLILFTQILARSSPCDLQHLKE